MSKPLINKLNFKDHASRNDPWTYFGQLRSQGDVIRIKLPLLGISWGVTSYETVNEVLKDSERFVRNPKNAGRRTFGKIQWLLPRVFKSLMFNMLGADGLDHPRLRSIVDAAFTMRNIESMSDRIRVIASEQLEVAVQSMQQNGHFDLLRDFARPYPLTVICELLGLPMGDRQKFGEWFRPMTEVSSVFHFFKIKKGITQCRDYLKQQFEEVSRNPRDGLMSQLVQVEHDGDKLNEKELLSMVFLLLIAGHETTVHLISNSVFTLLKQPEIKSKLLNDWSNSDRFIEETLRYASPLQFAKPRFVAQDMEFHGQSFRRKEMVTPLLACANYDPGRFKYPNEFNMDRERNYHMSFGSGPHVCLGMKLARVETHHAIQSIFERWPSLTPAFKLSHPDWSNRIGTRGFKTMKLTETK